ncbi:MAG: hypothetical protein AAFR61_07650 [Bacteroidota bacterium]
MKNALSVLDIEQLVQAFINRTLPATAWTHEAHLLVAFWHNWTYEYAEALALVRERIRAYNEAVGTANTDTSGYHETLTVFWMRLTRNFLEEHPDWPLEKAVQEFLQSPHADKQLPLTFYDRKVLFSVKARKEWVEGTEPL